MKRPYPSIIDAGELAKQDHVSDEELARDLEENERDLRLRESALTTLRFFNVDGASDDMIEKHAAINEQMTAFSAYLRRLQKARQAVTV